MAAKRSRTGCQTCRSRKLKCDEVKPICGHCAKSSRECVRSDGIAFRHEQNPSMNATIPKPDRKLKNFFDYRETYTDEDKRSFLPTQQFANNLTWIAIDNPMDEDQNPSNPNNGNTSYQQVASHSLEALSTAATDHHPTYLPPGNYADYNTHAAGQNAGRTGYGPVMHGQNPRNTDLDRTAQQELGHEIGEMTSERVQPVPHVGEDIEEPPKGEGNDFDVLHLLRDVAEQPAG